MSYTWNGPAGKGAMKTRRAQKKAEAEERNAAGNPVWTCTLGHRHGRKVTCPAGAS